MWHALAFFPTAYVSGFCWPDSTNRWQLRYERVRAALVDVQVELQDELYRRCACIRWEARVWSYAPKRKVDALNDSGALGFYILFFRIQAST